MHTCEEGVLTAASRNVPLSLCIERFCLINLLYNIRRHTMYRNTFTNMSVLFERAADKVDTI